MMSSETYIISQADSFNHLEEMNEVIGDAAWLASLQEMTIQSQRLKAFVLRSYSFQSLQSLQIVECPNLHTLLIENDVMCNMVNKQTDLQRTAQLTVQKCMSLSVLTIGKNSCSVVKEFSITSK